MLGALIQNAAPFLSLADRDSMRSTTPVAVLSTDQRRAESQRSNVSAHTITHAQLVERRRGEASGSALVVEPCAVAPPEQRLTFRETVVEIGRKSGLWSDKAPSDKFTSWPPHVYHEVR